MLDLSSMYLRALLLASLILVLSKNEHVLIAVKSLRGTFEPGFSHTCGLNGGAIIPRNFSNT